MVEGLNLSSMNNYGSNDSEILWIQFSKVGSLNSLNSMIFTLKFIEVLSSTVSLEVFFLVNGPNNLPSYIFFHLLGPASTADPLGRLPHQFLSRPWYVEDVLAKMF